MNSVLFGVVVCNRHTVSLPTMAVASLHSCARRWASTTSKHGMILGSGSNVIDAFFPMRKLPMPGDKAYFAQEKFMAGSVVGGVTLNHLAWARMLGAPTGLMALQGTDENGKQIRRAMAAMGVSSEFVRVDDAYTTSVSHVLIEESGERTILMAPASTSQLTATKMKIEFADAIAGASMITTEISQVPLSGVQYLLAAARSHGIPSVLDVDVTPSIAVGAARLGSLDELRSCVTQATVLKLTASAAAELLSLVSTIPLESRLEHISAQLADAFGVRLCIVTDGSNGSALSLGRPSNSAPRAVEPVLVPIYTGVTQKDATGESRNACVDAILGECLMACLRFICASIA